MASTWTQTRNKIIKRAYRAIGVLPSGQELSASQLNDGVEAFEGLLKSLANESIYLYKIDWFIKNLTASSEVIGSDTLNYTCYRAHNSSTDNQPITGGQYKAFWRQEGTSGVAWTNLTDYNYIGDVHLDSDILNILKLFYRDSSNNDIQIKLVDRETYAEIVDKDDVSTYPHIAWHDKKDQVLHLWPAPSSVNDYVLHLQAQRVIGDLTNPNTIPDAETNMYEMLVFGLAYKLSFENVIPIGERDYVKQEYENLKAWKKTNNRDDEEVNMKQGAY